MMNKKLDLRKIKFVIADFERGRWRTTIYPEGCMPAGKLVRFYHEGKDKDMLAEMVEWIPDTDHFSQRLKIIGDLA